MKENINLREFKASLDQVHSQFKIAMDLRALIKSNLQTQIEFFDFYDDLNGGYAYFNSLHLYGIVHKPEYHNINYNNFLIKKEFKKMVDGLFFFAEDVFANQFGFSSQGVVMFNIETGEYQLICNTFNEWVHTLLSNLDFYSGYSIAKSWSENHGEIPFNQRLAPKIPFVLGGNYDLSNLFLSEKDNIIKSSANLARQIKNLPNGTPFEIKIVD